MKILVSLRLESDFVDRVDTLAVNGDRSRNFMMNKLLGETLKRLEKRHGKVKVNHKELEKLRAKRRPTGDSSP